ncbi:MAG: gliding motility-associated C-terminal domain-containing protein, partial [Saprospiraceae bacterium]
NPAGCDTATVTFYIECKVFLIFNGFSPNGDNINETFTIDGIENFPNNQIQIFNRWGNMVFEQAGYKGQWNGTWNNKDLPDGTYFYFLDNGEGKQYSGFLEIRR